jgi:hypothetical protein
LESDGSLSVSTLLNLAAKKELDFLAITDHNVHSGWFHNSRNTCLLIKAIELTTYYGHANAFGLYDWVDWRIGKDKYGVNDMIQEVHQQEGLFSINHPRTGNSPNDHAAWKIVSTDYQQVDALEVWNASVINKDSLVDQETLQFWDHLLNQGYRITGIGGSDAHYQNPVKQPLGCPMTYIYANSLSERSLLEGIKKGHVFITVGPEVFFTATNKTGKKVMAGDDLILVSPKEEIGLHLKIKNAPINTKVRLIKNGEIVHSENINSPGCFSTVWLEELNLTEISPCKIWYRVELYGEEGLIALTNPIYFSLAENI